VTSPPERLVWEAIAPDEAMPLPRRALRAAAWYARALSRRLDVALLARAMGDARQAAAHTTSWTHVDELRMLYTLAALLPRNARALEIGSHLGASALYIASGLRRRGGHLYCVDTWQNDAMPDPVTDTFDAFQSNIAPVAEHITVIRKRSETLTAADIETPLDLVFIDGDHDYAAVRRDFLLSESLLGRGGAIAFHDFGNPLHAGVSRVVGEALASGDWVMRGVVRSLAWIERMPT